nr:10621_t:CDS:2 [Entrophospora candida]CAG8645238.1 11137_t:CDS:2 [Entrophospora candida]
MEETQKVVARLFGNVSVSQDSSTSTKATSNIKTEQGIKNLIFGSISGMTGKLVEYPFDTVKTRLQSQPSDRKLFNGPLDCFKKTISKDGFLGLYWGLSSPMIGAILENATLFLAYNHIQMLIREHTTPIDQRHLLYDNNYQKDAGQIPLSMTQLILAGALSGVLTSFLLTPIELVKCKLQVQETFSYDTLDKNTSINNIISKSNKPTITVNNNQLNYSGPLSVIKYTLKAHGIKGFYCGHFGTFIQETFGVVHGLVHMSITELMLSGALAGMVYNLLIFPADSIKSQMQTEEEFLSVIGKSGNKKRGFIKVGKDLYKADGIKGFYRGCVITVTRAAPSSAIIFLTYVSVMMVTVVGGV